MTTINLLKIVPEANLEIGTGTTIFTEEENPVNSSTGSIILAGGLGVSKKIYVGENLNVTGNITGTFAGTAVSVTRGGTGATSFTATSVLLGNGTSALIASSMTYSSDTLTLPKLISNDATDSSSITTGAVVLSGGLGVAKKVYVGTDLNVAGNITGNFVGTLISVARGGTGATSFTTNSVLLGNGTSALIASGLSYSSDTLTLPKLISNDATDSSSVSTGAVVLSGGLGVAKRLYVGTDLNVAGNITGTFVGTTVGVARGGTGATSFTANAVLLGNGTSALIASGLSYSSDTLTLPKLISNDATDSSSVSTGAVVLSGGLGVAKRLYVGTDLNVAGNITGTFVGTTVGVARGGTGATSFTANAVLLGNGTSALIASAMTYSSDTLTLPKLISNDATDSSSVSTGAVVLSGGLGVAKRLYIGTDLNVTGNITGTFVGTTVGVTRGGTGATSFTANSVLLGNGTSALIASGLSYSSDTLTLPKLISNDATDSSSVSTGAVVLSGGLGVAKRLYIGTDLNVSGNITGTFIGTTVGVTRGGTGATSFTANSVLLGNGTSALIASAMTYSSDTLTLPKLISNDSTDSSSVSTGAVVLSGGLGVAKSLYAGTDLNVAGNITGTFVGTTISVAGGGTGATSFTANSVLLGNGTSAIIASAMTYSSDTLTLPKLISNDTTDSSSITTGAVILSGGLGVAKRLYVGPTSGLGSVSIIDGKVDNVDVSVLNKRLRVSNEERTLTYNLETANPSGNAWRGICWSSELGLFVAVAYNGSFRVMISSNGIIWLNRSAAVDDAWSSIVWSAELSLFVVVGESGAQRVMTSPDGSTWTIRAATEQTNWSEVCWSPELGLFVAVGYTGTNRVMSSSNGTTWTATDVGTSVAWYGVCWSPELALFIATGNSGVMTSTNGTTWISRTPASSRHWWSVKWSPELSLLACVAFSGTDNRVMTSPDGITWTSRTTPADNQWVSLVWSPELSLFTAVARSGTTRMMISYDGITWVLRAPPAAENWWDITWSRELSVFCAVSDSGTQRVMTSHPKIPSSKSTLVVNPARINTSSLGVLTLSNTTSTTSSTTGSLITSGGIGISNTTDATSIINGGTLTTAGGIAVAKKIFAGERVTQVGGGRDNSFVAISTGSGATQSGIALDAISGSSGTGNRWNIYSDSTTRRLQIFNVTTGVEAFDITNTGQVICRTAIASTNSSNGNLLVTGGISISGTTDSSSSTNGGTFTTAGGMAIAKRLFVGDFGIFENSSSITIANTPISLSVFHSGNNGYIEVGLANAGGQYSFSVSGGDSVIRNQANRNLYIQNGTGSHAIRIVNNLVYVNSVNDLVHSIPTTVTASGFMSAYIQPNGCQLYTASSAGVASGVATMLVTSNSADNGGYFRTSPAQFDFWRTYINLVPGTYTFRLHCGTGTDRAIATIRLNDTTIGTLDTFAAYGRALSSLTGVVITINGPCKFEIQLNTRNASSSGWFFVWMDASFIRTS